MERDRSGELSSFILHRFIDKGPSSDAPRERCKGEGRGIVSLTGAVSVIHQAILTSGHGVSE